MIYVVISLILFFLVAIFALQNATLISVKFLFWETHQISHVLIILGSAAIGALVVFFAGISKVLKLTIEKRQLDQKNVQLLEEYHELKEKLKINNDDVNNDDESLDNENDKNLEDKQVENL